MRIIESEKVKTRKEHECVGCLRKIPKGTKMNVVIFEDGGIYHAYWRPVCQHILNETFFEDEFIPEGEIKNGDPEHWERIRREISGFNGCNWC